uniref:Uncharacterized protein n=1 Tax=Stomoxys calcitrans TaxID=35570 RepID=A0A1I8PI11_STOCA
MTQHSLGHENRHRGQLLSEWLTLNDVGVLNIPSEKYTFDGPSGVSAVDVTAANEAAFTAYQFRWRRDFTIDVSGLNLKIHDWDYVKSEHHYLYGRKVIYIDFTLTKNITEFDIAFSFDMVKKDNRKMNIIKIDLDGCASLESSHSKMNFVKVIFRELFRVSNIPKKCPIFARDYTIEITNSSMKILDYDLVKIFTHKIYDSRNIYVEVYLNKPLTEFRVNIEFSVITKSNRHVRLSNFNFDGCEALYAVHKTNFLKVMFQEIYRVSNIPRKCPFLKNKLYIINNYTLRDEDYPPFAPAMEWQVNADLFGKKKQLTEIVIAGRIRKLN